MRSRALAAGVWGFGRVGLDTGLVVSEWIGGSERIGGFGVSWILSILWDGPAVPLEPNIFFLSASTARLFF